jgi:hypothetical protein
MRESDPQAVVGILVIAFATSIIVGIALLIRLLLS